MKYEAEKMAAAGLNLPACDGELAQRKNRIIGLKDFRFEKNDEKL
jgi:hypothetical protein